MVSYMIYNVIKAELISVLILIVVEDGLVLGMADVLDNDTNKS